MGNDKFGGTLIADLVGKRISIFGLGRSGYAVARASVKRGASVTVFEEASESKIGKPELVAELKGIGANLILDWDAEVQSDSLKFDFWVVNPAVDMRHPTLLKLQSFGVEIISEVEFAYRISLAPIVAVTGTNGKSTTVVMAWLALKSCGIDSILCGNIYGSGYPEMSLTEAADSSGDDQVLVAEISSFQLEWIKDFKPVSASITNISDDHSERYDSFDQYRKVKERIFENLDENCVAVIPGKDPVIKFQNESQGCKILTFGRDGVDAKVDLNTIAFMDKIYNRSDFDFFEPHNAVNASNAALMAWGYLYNRFQVSPKSAGGLLFERCQYLYSLAPLSGRSSEYAIPTEIIDGLKQFKGLKHRMEFVGEKNGIRIYNNSMCTNPGAVISGLHAIPGVVHAIVGGVTKGSDFVPFRDYLDGADAQVYLFGQDGELINKVLGGTYPVFHTMEEAFYDACEHVSPGQTIILSPGCSSRDQFRDFRERGDVFRNIALDWIKI